MDRLSTQGWLQVNPADSGRGLRCTLTASGRRRLVKVLPAWDEAQAAASRLLGRGGVRALRDVARSVTPEPGSSAPD